MAQGSQVNAAIIVLFLPRIHQTVLPASLWAFDYPGKRQIRRSRQQQLESTTNVENPDIATSKIMCSTFLSKVYDSENL